MRAWQRIMHGLSHGFGVAAPSYQPLQLAQSTPRNRSSDQLRRASAAAQAARAWLHCTEHRLVFAEDCEADATHVSVRPAAPPLAPASPEWLQWPRGVSCSRSLCCNHFSAAKPETNWSLWNRKGSFCGSPDSCFRLVPDFHDKPRAWEQFVAQTRKQPMMDESQPTHRVIGR